MSKRPFAIIGGQIVFTDGAAFTYPPSTPEDKSEIIAKLERDWAPHCRNCGSPQTPIIRADKRVVAMCAECNHVKALTRLYSRMSDEDLRGMFDEIQRSSARRRKAVELVIARRERMAGGR